MSRYFLYLFLAALIIRVVLFIGIWNFFGINGIATGDAPEYLNLADNIHQGLGFGLTTTDGDVIPAMFRTPVYPLIIAISYWATDGLALVLVLQIILGSLMPPLVFILGHQLGITNKSALLLASILAMIEPLLVAFSFLLVTEIIFSALFLASFIFLIRFLKTAYWGDGVMAGLFLGMATLTRPITIYYPLLVVVIILVFWSLKKIELSLVWKPLICFLIIFGAVLSPWLLRNYLVFGKPTVSSIGMIDAFFDYLPSIYVVRDGITYGEAEQVIKKSFLNKYNLPANYFSGRGPLDDYFNPQETDRALIKKEIFETVRNNIGSVLKLQLIIFSSFFTHDNTAYFLQRYKLLPPRPDGFSTSLLINQKGWKAWPQIFQSLGVAGFISLVGRMFWLAVFILSIWGSVYLRRSYQASWLLIALLWGTILYFALLSSVIGLGVEARLRLPIEPLLFVLAALGFSEAWRVIRRH